MSEVLPPPPPIAVYAFRKSCLPFDFVFGVVEVEEAVSVVDSIEGPNCYSLQFNVNCKNGAWPQIAFQFDRKAGFMELQFYESAKTVGLITSVDKSTEWSDAQMPNLSGLDPGYFFNFEIQDDGQQLTGFASILYDLPGLPGHIVWQMSKPFVFPTYDNPLIATLRVVGLGGGSVAKFSSGKFMRIVDGPPDVNDMDSLLVMPLQGAPQTPCGTVVETTDENSNLIYPEVSASGENVSAEAQCPT